MHALLQKPIIDHFPATVYGFSFCRWEHGVQTELLQHPALTAGALSLLVLDNTYCHPRYAHHLQAGLIPKSQCKSAYCSAFNVSRVYIGSRLCQAVIAICVYGL